MVVSAFRNVKYNRMPANERKRTEIVKQLLLVNSAATVVAVIFSFANFGSGSLSRREFASSFVYSNCIGTLILASIFYLSPRWNKNLSIVRLAKVFVSIFFATIAGVLSARLILSFIFPSLSYDGLIPSR